MIKLRNLTLTCLRIIIIAHFLMIEHVDIFYYFSKKNHYLEFIFISFFQPKLLPKDHFYKLNTGYWILDIGYWILDTCPSVIRCSSCRRVAMAKHG